MVRIFTALTALALTALPLAAQAQDRFATNIPSELSFTENYAEEVVTEIDNGEVLYWDVPDATSKFTVTGRVSAQGMDLSALNGDSQFKFFLEFFRVSGKLSDDPEYVPGATSARIPLRAYDYNSDTNIVAGYLAISWTEAQITFSADVAAPETYSIVLNHYIDENEQFNDTASFHFTFGGRALDRTVYYTGKATTKTKVYGQGEDADELDISTMEVTGALDSAGPTLAITDPAEGARVGTDRVSVSGTATDPRNVVQVAVQANGGEFVPATIVGNRWSIAGVPLEVGANTLRVMAVDSEGNETVVQRLVTRLTPLTVTVAGSGSVSKDFRGTTLQAPGSSVTIVAKANPGYVFSTWTGSVTSTEPSISFVVEPGMTITANFVPLPFGSLHGRYMGLVQTDEGMPMGLVQLTLNQAGRFTAKFSLDGRKTRLKAVFDASGRATGVAPRKKGLPPLRYDLQMDLENGSGTIEGTVTDGATVYTIDTDRIVKTKGVPLPFTGAYTAVLRPVATEEPGVPTSDGWATIKVKPDGKVKISGQLGDGTLFESSAEMSSSGRISIYAKVRKTRTAISGTLEFASEHLPAEIPFGGLLVWTKHSTTGGAFPAGFKTQVEVIALR